MRFLSESHNGLPFLEQGCLYYGGHISGNFRALYISDLHLDSHISLLGKPISKADVKKYIEKIANELYDSFCNLYYLACHPYALDAIVFSGDIADGVNADVIVTFFRFFMKSIHKFFSKHLLSSFPVIFVLGNHECVGFCSIKDAVSYYKQKLLPFGVCVLQNECIEINKHMRSIIVYGGIGFSRYDKNDGTDAFQDSLVADEFEQNYLTALKGAQVSGKCFICVSHYSPEACLPNLDSSAVYISGHTHHNRRVCEPNFVLYADGQVGYTSNDFVFQYMTTGVYPNPYDMLPDGIYTTTIDVYQKFCMYANLQVARFTYLQKCCASSDFYVLKKSGYYGFFLVNSHNGILIVRGGTTRTVTKTRSIEWVYENFDNLVSRYVTAMKPIRQIQEQISVLLRDFGLSGRIHGLIVDVDFYHHIAVNLDDGTLVYYYSPDFGLVKIFSDVSGLLSHSGCLSKAQIKQLQKALDLSNVGQFCLNRSSDVHLSNILSSAGLDSEFQTVSKSDGLYGLSRHISPFQRLFSSHVLQVFDISLLDSDGENKKRKKLYVGQICYINGSEYFVEQDDGGEVLLLRDINTLMSRKVSVVALRRGLSSRRNGVRHGFWVTKSIEETEEQYPDLQKRIQEQLKQERLLPLSMDDVDTEGNAP